MLVLYFQKFALFDLLQREVESGSANRRQALLLAALTVGLGQKHAAAAR